MHAKLNSKAHLKINIPFLSLFGRVSLQSFKKVQKVPIESKLFLKNINMGIIQNAELDADFKSVKKKTPKKFIPKKLEAEN